MIEKILYSCQICNTDYTDKEKAIACEKSHKSLKTQKNPGPMPWIQEIMKKKSFRMVLVYKAKPKVFLKWQKYYVFPF